MPAAKIWIVGMGPGMQGYLTEYGHRIILDADALIGTKKHLERYTGTKTKIVLQNSRQNYNDIIKFIIENKSKVSIALMVSGDPCMFSFARKIICRLQPHEYEIVPGISAVQILCARTGLAWDDMRFVSLHGRTRRGLCRAVKMNDNVCIFTDYKNTPRGIAQFLYVNGIKKRSVAVGEDLSYKNEIITETTISNLKDMKKEWSRLCIVLIRR